MDRVSTAVRLTLLAYPIVNVNEILSDMLAIPCQITHKCKLKHFWKMLDHHVTHVLNRYFIGVYRRGGEAHGAAHNRHAWFPHGYQIPDALSYKNNSCLRSFLLGYSRTLYANHAALPTSDTPRCAPQRVRAQYRAKGTTTIATGTAKRQSLMATQVNIYINIHLFHLHTTLLYSNLAIPVAGWNCDKSIIPL
jgi:hypothetical protein